MRDSDLDRAVVAERAGNVVDLLESAGPTDNPEADEHVAAALDIARELAADPPR